LNCSNMFSDRDFIIPFVGLKEGKHGYNYKLENEFFESFDYGLIGKGRVEFDIVLEKLSTFMIMHSDFGGVVNVECDKCLDEITVKINGSNRLVIKFGDDEGDVSEDMLVLPQNAYELDIKQYLYEYVMVGLPSKRVHKDGECNRSEE